MTAIGALEGVGLSVALSDPVIQERRNQAVQAWMDTIPRNETWVIPQYDTEGSIQYGLYTKKRKIIFSKKDWRNWFSSAVHLSVSVSLDTAWLYARSQKKQKEAGLVLRTITLNIPSMWVGGSVCQEHSLPLTQAGWFAFNGNTWESSCQTNVMETLYEVLVWCIRTYVQNTGAKGVVLGLSGGIDSALILALACDAVGASNVKAIMMPTRYTSSMSLEDAQKIAMNFGVSYRVIPIEKIFMTFLERLNPILQNRPWDVTEENLQARIRGTILMACSNKENRLLLCTTNKAEAAMGYGTLYGDLTGGLAPLLDLWKSQVQALCMYRNQKSGGRMIPVRIIERRPSAELRRNQRDTDSLPAYDVIEHVITQYMQQKPLDRDDELVQWILQRLVRHNFKRAQGIPGPVVSNEPLSLLQNIGMTSRW